MAILPTTKSSILIAALVILTITTLRVRPTSSPAAGSSWFSSIVITKPWSSATKPTQHPVVARVAEARDRLSKPRPRQSKTFDEAVAEYKRRYKRAPPNGFDKWYKLAVAANVTLIDEFDLMTQSLEPFWGISARSMRARLQSAMKTNAWLTKFEIKHHKLDVTQDRAPAFYRENTVSWMEPYMEYLPDMTFATNALDEPRAVVPYSRLQGYMQHCPSKEIQTQEHNEQRESDEVGFVNINNYLEHADYEPHEVWQIATLSCSPEYFSDKYQSTKRAQPLLPLVEDPAEAKDVCKNPQYAHQHGVFTAPLTFSVTTSLIPIFSQAKLSTSADIQCTGEAARQADMRLGKITTECIANASLSL